MRILDSRRLRGPNLQTRVPAAIAEVVLEDGESPREAALLWREEVQRIAGALGWSEHAGGAVAREFPGGFAFALPAPIDVLYEATEANDWAIARATGRLAGQGADDFEEERARLAAELQASANPHLCALRAEAHKRKVAFLWDDESVTLGMAKTSRTWSRDALPTVEEVEWSALADVPIALVTGTNGKTTTTRLVARMARIAGRVVGNTSSDGIAIEERIVEPGDWTGAEAARALLRRPEVQMAILETARGGILRRGLAVDTCDAALVTNVTSDHLGEFGVCDLETMARTKAVVGEIVREGGRVVLSADDPELVKLVPRFAAKVVLCSALGESPLVRAHVARGGEAYVTKGGAIVRLAGGDEHALVRVDEAPLTFGGAAPHNVANCVAAAALAWSMHVPDDAVARALRTFGADPADNPRRGELVELASGVRVLLDFGHNPAGLRDLYALARSLLRPGCVLLSAHSLAGDRSEADFADFAGEIAAASPSFVVFWENEAYRRGRAPGWIQDRLRAGLVASGFGADAIVFADNEAGALERALDRANGGDLVVLAPYTARDAVHAVLAR
jgi:cyanophycin synthetase